MAKKKVTKKKTAGEVVAQEAKQNQEAQKLSEPLEESMHPSKKEDASLVKALDRVIFGKPVSYNKPFTFVTEANDHVEFLFKPGNQVMFKPEGGYKGGWIPFQESDIALLKVIVGEIAKGEPIRS